VNDQLKALHQQRTNHFHDVGVTERAFRCGDDIESIGVDPIGTAHDSPAWKRCVDAGKQVLYRQIRPGVSISLDRGVHDHATTRISFD
jgi:hypothetical protein